MEKKEGKERKVWRRREGRKGKESMKEKEKKVWRRERKVFNSKISKSNQI